MGAQPASNGLPDGADAPVSGEEQDKNPPCVLRVASVGLTDGSSTLNGCVKEMGL